MNQHHSNIFKCKTPNAFQIKVLIDLLSVSLQKASFEVTDEGIKMSYIVSNHSKIFDVFLDAKYFDIYKFKAENNIDLGLTLSDFNRLLKSIKKKDILELFVHDENSQRLGICTIPSTLDKSRVTTTEMTVQKIQNLEIELPEGYQRFITVPASDFQQMCKDLKNIGNNTITVISSGFSIAFSCKADSIMSRTVQFGDPNESDEEDEVYEQTFQTEQFTNIQKIAGLCDKLQIYRKMGLPLLIKANIGPTSHVSIYINSNEMSDFYDDETTDEEDSDDDSE
jgi:DNA polymerase III sliding clamp (beta) subunit (PCNA family)